MDPLDLERLDEHLKQYALALTGILSSPDKGNIEKHLNLARKAPTGYMDSEHFGEPAVFTLLIYGEAGIEALRRLCAEGVESYGGIWPSLALASAFVHADAVPLSHIRLAARYLNAQVYERVAASAIATCNDEAASLAARDALRGLVQLYLSKAPDELGSFMAHLDLSLSAVPSGRRVVTDLMLETVARNSLRLSEGILQELVDLVAQDLPEAKYQEFFERHPVLLDPMASSVLKKQVLGAEFESDFVIRRFDDQYVLVEIEKPRDPPFTKYPHPSQQLSHALGQVLNWFAWLEDNIAYAQNHGYPSIHSPTGLIIIGRDSDLSPQQRRVLRTLNDTLYPRISVYTFDTVMANARNVLANLTGRP